MSTTALPTLPEQVTAEWLSSVLNQPIKSIETTNQVLVATTSKLFITCKYDDDDNSSKDRPSRIVVKGGFNPPLQAPLMPMLRGMYNGEVNFYSVIATLLPANVKTPKTWWAAAEPDQGIIIMDDLAASGHTFGDAEFTWPPARVRQTVEQLAGLHVATWNRTASEPVAATASSPAIQAVQYPTSQTYEFVLQGLCAMFPDLILAADRPETPKEWHSYERIIAAIKRHFATRNPRFSCLIHGDAHVGNTYLEPVGKDEPAADTAGLDGYRGYFLDWQTTHVGSNFHDVAYFIGGALSIEDRRKHELDIVDHYLATLAKLGGPKLSRDDPEVMKEYAKSCLAGWGWLLTPDHTQSTARVHAMVPRFVAQMQDHNTLQTIEEQ